MPSAMGFLFANCQDQRPVHLQREHGRTPCGGQWNDGDSVPAEMVEPPLTPWMK